IDFPLVFAAFDNNAVVPEVGNNISGFATFKDILARVTERRSIHCKQLLQRSVFGSQPEELAFHGAIDQLQFGKARRHNSDIVEVSVPYRAGNCTAVTQIESPGSSWEIPRHQESHHSSRNDVVKSCSKHGTRLALTITIRTPSLNGVGLSTDGFRLQRTRCVKEHLQACFAEFNSAVDFASALLSKHHQFGARREVIQELQFGFASTGKLVESNPVVRTDVN